METFWKISLNKMVLLLNLYVCQAMMDKNKDLIKPFSSLYIYQQLSHTANISNNISVIPGVATTESIIFHPFCS